MRLSERVRNLSPSSTLAITSRIKLLKKQGINVINFAAGEPDFDTPDFVKNAGILAIQSGFTRYTPTSGILELKEAIVKKFKQDNGLDYALEQIVVSCGAKHSIFNSICALVEPGDEVIIPLPFWVSYPEMVKFCQGKAIFLRTQAKNSFKLNSSQLKNAITPKTKLLILNYPSNPSGVVYTASELEEIADICVSKNIFVLSDEIYEKLIYDGQKHYSIAGINKKIYDLTITVNGLSKSFSMTGWRVGFLAAHPDIASAVSKLQDHSTSNSSSISQKAALAALASDGLWVEKIRREFQLRRDLMTGLLDAIDGITYVKPGGAFYVFADISKTNLDADTFAKKLLEDEHVAVIPGTDFGRKDFVRLSFATSIDEIKEGMRRIDKWLKQLPKKS